MKPALPAKKKPAVSFNVSGNITYNTNEVTNYKGQLVEGYVTDPLGNKVYQTNLGAVSTGDVNRILEDHKINEYYLYKVYKGSGTYFNTDGTVNIDGGPKDGMMRTPVHIDLFFGGEFCMLSIHGMRT